METRAGGGLVLGFIVALWGRLALARRCWGSLWLYGVVGQWRGGVGVHCGFMGSLGTGGAVLGFIVALWGRWALAGDVGTGTDVDGFCSDDRLDFRGIVVSALVGSGEAHPCIVF